MEPGSLESARRQLSGYGGVGTLSLGIRAFRIGGEGRMTAATACRKCGIEPLADARFCHGCGSPVAEAETRAEYKQVTRQD